MDELLALLKTKRYPMSRMKRMVALRDAGNYGRYGCAPARLYPGAGPQQEGAGDPARCKKGGDFSCLPFVFQLERDFARYARPEFLATELFGSAFRRTVRRFRSTATSGPVILTPRKIPRKDE